MQGWGVMTALSVIAVTGQYFKWRSCPPHKACGACGVCVDIVTLAYSVYQKETCVRTFICHAPCVKNIHEVKGGDGTAREHLKQC